MFNISTRSSRRIDKEELIKILKEVDIKLERKIKLTAIGGTALNILGLKQTTQDIDFIIEDSDPLIKADIITTIYKQGVETQLQDPGTIVIYKLPKDYRKKSLEDKELNKNFTKINIKILTPIDIIITKLNRFEPKDITDITNILNNTKYDLKIIEKRFKQYYNLFPGNKQKLMNHFIQFKELYNKIYQ